PRLISLSSGPTAATPPAAAALEVPTAGVPTYLVDSPPRATEAAADAAAATGRAAGAAAGLAAGDGAGAAAACGAGSPSRAVTSASVSAASPFRPRRACSAAIADLLHFFPSATHLATSSLITPEAGAEAEAAAGGADSAGAAGTDVATVVAVELPPSPRSHGIGSPAFSASISVSLRRGRPFL